ncbi:hypothetical protein APR41_16655 [Salegentibacter salinarum]|uniref:DUF4129 domain-containing protein n=1 Tax=Salegentibacter salinarum TaxID=447422 RepID=A0A2N0TWV4_9FLAO|nr:hypothetical protein [Salegentibacter salinarum]PKD19220.1 hypothetical protein APR41_16655 [Salegentibacter salinarum]SKB94513.1 hypothetical protein SAMN05660903_03408 [Salegentibacter salinarum]
MFKILILFSFIFFGNLIPQEEAVTDSTEMIQNSSEETLEEVGFDTEKIENYKADKAFDYLEKIEEDSWWTRLKRWINLKWNAFLQWLFGDYETNTFWGAVLSAVPYILLILVLGLITWLFIRLNPGNAVMAEPITGKVNLKKEEDIVKSADISSLIDVAIRDENYRLAVRYLYLKSLRILDQKEHIQYRFQKTNEDYITEINAPEIKNQFTKITHLYDFIWYGDFELSKPRFEKVNREFTKMENNLKTGNNG